MHCEEAIVAYGDAHLLIDRAAPLRRGDTVAVVWDGRVVMVGQLRRRPVPHRRFAIEVVQDNGKVRCSRSCGPHDAEVWRVMGRGRFIPI